MNYRTASPLLLGLLLLVPVLWTSLASANEPAKPLDLQKQLDAQTDRISRLEAQLQNQGLLNLFNQVEALKADIARLRGAQEELANQQSLADKRVKDWFGDLEERVKELENRPVASAPAPDAVRLQPAQVLSVPTLPPVSPAQPASNTAVTTPPAAAPATPVADPGGDTRAYDAAYAQVKAGRYKEAGLAMQNFAQAFPNSSLVPNALYWAGFSYVGQSDFANAGASFQSLIQRYPNHPKTADAMLSLARAQIQMNTPNDATVTLEQLVARFPYTKAAAEGKKLLANLK